MHSNQLSFGALFVGRRWDDYDLISAASAYERATRIRETKRPVIHSDIELPVNEDLRAGRVLSTF